MPKRLQVFEDSLYITLSNQTIYRIDKFGRTKGEVFVESFQRTSDLLILHPLKQDPKSIQHKLFSVHFLPFRNSLTTIIFRFSIESLCNRSM